MSGDGGRGGGDGCRRGGGREFFGAGVIPKFVYFTDFTLFLCTSMQ